MFNCSRREFIYTSMVGMAGLSAGVPLMAKGKNNRSVVFGVRCINIQNTIHNKY